MNINRCSQIQRSLCEKIVGKKTKEKKKLKSLITKRSIKTAVVAVIGFLCGLIFDSAIFAINPIICGVAEAVLLSGVYYALSVKEGRGI